MNNSRREEDFFPPMCYTSIQFRRLLYPLEKFNYRTSANSRFITASVAGMVVVAGVGMAGAAASFAVDRLQAGVILLFLSVVELFLHRGVSRRLERYRNESLVLHGEYLEHHSRKGVRNVPYETIRRLYYSGSKASRRTYTVEVRPSVTVSFDSGIERCGELVETLQRKTRKSFGYKPSGLQED